MPVMPPGSRRSTAMLVRQTCGNLKFVVGDVQLVAGRGRAGHVRRLVRVRIRVERPNAVVLSSWSKPVSTPVLPSWFEIQT